MILSYTEVDQQKTQFPFFSTACFPNWTIQSYHIFFPIAVILWWYIGLTSLPSIHHKHTIGKTVFSTRILTKIWFTNKIIVFYAWHKYSLATYSRSRAQHKVPWHQLGFQTVQNDQNMKNESKSTLLGLIHYGQRNLTCQRFINKLHLGMVSCIHVQRVYICVFGPFLFIYIFFNSNTWSHE